MTTLAVLRLAALYVQDGYAQRRLVTCPQCRKRARLPQGADCCSECVRALVVATIDRLEQEAA